MVLELVCGFDCWCNLHCRTTPVVLEGFWDQVWPSPPPPTDRPTNHRRRLDKPGRKPSAKQIRPATQPQAHDPPTKPGQVFAHDISPCVISLLGRLLFLCCKVGVGVEIREPSPKQTGPNTWPRSKPGENKQAPSKPGLQPPQKPPLA